MARRWRHTVCVCVWSINSCPDRKFFDVAWMSVEFTWKWGFDFLLFVWLVQNQAENTPTHLKKKKKLLKLRVCWASRADGKPSRWAIEHENQSVQAGGSAEQMLDTAHCISLHAAVLHLASLMTMSPMKPSRALREKNLLGLRPHYK